MVFIECLYEKEKKYGKAETHIQKRMKQNKNKIKNRTKFSNLFVCL